MRPLVSTSLAGLCLLLCTAATRPAFAEPSADDRAVARSLFEQARTMMKDGNYAPACPKLEESQRLDEGVGTLFNLAECYEHVGRFASAWAAFGEVADISKRAGHEDREAVARERMTALVPKLSKMRVHMAAPLPPGLELRYDDKPLSAAILDTETPVDPGEHTIRATAPGKTPAETKLKIEPGTGVASVELPMLADVSAAPAVVPAPIGPAPAADTSTHGPSWQKPAAVALGAGALVALGVGTIFGLKASSEWSDAQKGSCPGACTDAGYGSWQDSKSSATVGTIGFVAGGVLAAAAIVLFVTAPSEASSPPAASAHASLSSAPISSRPLWRLP